MDFDAPDGPTISETWVSARPKPEETPVQEDTSLAIVMVILQCYNGFNAGPVDVMFTFPMKHMERIVFPESVAKGSF